MATTQNLLNLKIHKLSPEQYEREKTAGNLDPTALYLTPGSDYITAGQKEGTTLGDHATAEGFGNNAAGEYSHAEGSYTIASGQCAHAEGGSGTTASGQCAHAEGNHTSASGSASHAEGMGSTASGSYSHAEGFATIASGTGSYAAGSRSYAAGTAAHAEGYSTFDGASIVQKYADDLGCQPSDLQNYIFNGDIPNLESNPYFSVALRIGAHAEGEDCWALGEASHAEGYRTKAYDLASHTEGNNTAAFGGSHAEGYNTWAEYYSHAEGYHTAAFQNQHVQGHYNRLRGGDYSTDYTSGTAGTAFIIGNGSSAAESNAFRVDYNGAVYGLSSYNSSGADYAEYFEWLDKNVENEDRRGYFVTMEGENIKLAKPGDYILGIVSAQPAMIGNSDEDWRGRYILDDFGGFITEEFEFEEEILENIFDEETRETKTITKTITKTGIRYKQNPDYDPNKQYIQRADRPEWDAVGMMGVLAVRDDGTCQVNSYCTVADGGIATAADAGYRVIKRVNDHIVKVIFR